MDTDRFAYFAQRHTWGGGLLPVGLSRADRMQHTWIVGKSGVGKTALLSNLVISDMEAGGAVIVIDPHGDMAHELLEKIPRRRNRDVIVLDAGDTEYPVSLNFLRGRRGEPAHLIASRIVGAFKSAFSGSWGVRMEYVLFACVAALAEVENASLLGVQRMLVDEKYRDWVVRQVTDPAVRAFWETEFAGYDKRFAAEVISPVQNKLGALFLSAPLRQILGQVRCTIEPRFVIDHNKILICNLAKGKIGEEKAQLLGALLVAAFGQAALSRADIPELNRPHAFIFVDEFQNFVTDSFASSISEIRKFNVGLTLANQFIDQLREDIRNAVLGNVGNLIAFRVGASDAEILEREFAGAFVADQFTELANHEVLLKLLFDGEQREPFRARTLPPQGIVHSRRDQLIHASRQRYATPRAIVEEKIRRWMQNGGANRQF